MGLTKWVDRVFIKGGLGWIVGLGKKGGVGLVMVVGFVCLVIY